MSSLTLERIRELKTMGRYDDPETFEEFVELLDLAEYGWACREAGVRETLEDCANEQLDGLQVRETIERLDELLGRKG